MCFFFPLKSLLSLPQLQVMKAWSEDLEKKCSQNFFSIYPLQTILCALWSVFSYSSACLSFYCFLSLSCLFCCSLSLLPNIPFISRFLPSYFLSPLHAISFLFIQDYESKLQALQKQVETRSLAAEATEEEEEEEGEVQRLRVSCSVVWICTVKSVLGLSSKLGLVIADLTICWHFAEPI